MGISKNRIVNSKLTDGISYVPRRLTDEGIDRGKGISAVTECDDKVLEEAAGDTVFAETFVGSGEGFQVVRMVFGFGVCDDVQCNLGE